MERQIVSSAFPFCFLLRMGVALSPWVIDEVAHKADDGVLAPTDARPLSFLSRACSRYIN